MQNRSTTRVTMPHQHAAERIKNFSEVALGYTKEMAMEEAKRCLQCKTKPCYEGCPVQVPIPEFIQAVALGNFEEAYEIILTQNRLPAICGRVCPQENQCEGRCVRGIKGEPVAIGRMERFVADYMMEQGGRPVKKAAANGYKVAIVGSGPAGLTCASELASNGFEVTIYEALHEAGGVLVYGIPEFRLPKKLVKREIQNVLDLGVTLHKNVVIGRSLTVEDLKEEGYHAVFIGSGAGLPNFMKIPGENLNGVYSSNEFLTRVNLMKAYLYPEYPTPVQVGNKVAVVGAGNVAMDCARTAKRLGASEVSIVYRRGEEEIPARQEEVEHAKEEGIIFRLLTNPTEILGENGVVTKLVCEKMELSQADESGRRRPVRMEGSSHELEMDTVIIAIGQTPNPLIKDTTKEIQVTRWGGIVVEEETMQTTMPDVYAGGDAVTGAATVILAMGAGKKAAQAIARSLSSVR